jgi:FtsP/CotA-like multicopper oxidase with cupredoxin domain
VRLYLTNTANTRIFNVRLPGTRMKLVGGDSGRHERETFIDEVMLAPSERAIVDVLFDTPGTFALEHQTPDQTYVLGHIVVGDGPVEQSFVSEFEDLRVDPELTAERARLDADLHRDPDKTLAFESLMPLLYGDGTEDQTAALWTCPMHPEIVRAEPGVCPICGMKLVPKTDDEEAPAAHVHTHDTGDGIEWEDLMPEINKVSDPSNMIWRLVDRDTGKHNWEIDWAFEVGDRVKIRLLNEMAQDHPMHHPFHIHGAGRFLVLSRDGQPEANLVWKDTVLVRPAETVDILLEVSNPGLWMAHCHIAEHNQSGMMFSFPVAETT